MTETKNNKTTARKIASFIGTALTVLILIVALFVLVNAIIAKVQNKPVKFFGYSFAVVLTGSMEPEIMTGDLIIFRACDVTDIEVGDDIVFVADSSFGTLEGQNIVHRVIEVVDVSGSLGFKTQGINNSSADKEVVTESTLLGECIYNSAFWGKVFTFLSKYGVVILIAIVALPFIIKQVVKIIKLSKDGDEQPKE